MAAFPAYARLMMDRFQRRRPSGVKRTAMEGGLAKQRKVVSKVFPAADVLYSFNSKADYDNFLIFYETTINRVDWFDWTDPLDNVVRTARIVGGELTFERPLRRLLDILDVAFTIEWQ